MPKETASAKQTRNQLSIENFTGNPDVKGCLNQLNAEFGPGGKRPFIVSDTLDGEGHQYVNLVQKGGGVLGVALVGYTYILEQMGIRFLRLAGTSAGAINTALMTVIGKKTDVKSEKILRVICDLDFFKLVDGHPAARWIIKNFITHKDFTVKMKNWAAGIIIILALLILGDFTFFGLQYRLSQMSILTRLFFVLTGFYLLLVATLVYYVARLMKRLKNAGYGINPGDYFYDWIKKQLIDNDVRTVSDLNAKASEEVPGLHLRGPNPHGTTNLKGDVTFITSELVTQNKIQFPDMCYLFREKANIDQLQPAGFIRASMAIPIFFESYMITDIPCGSEEIKQAWWNTFGEKDPPDNARFVDGGMLSNFPLNIFYNPKILVPRLPSFGIDLDDTKPENESKNARSWSLIGYFGRMFNTIRYYYDKDFLLKNKVFEKGIGKIPLWQYNWLNFFLTDQDKIDMFVSGAQAATKFLLSFDWEEYKNDRANMQTEINTERSANATIQSVTTSPQA